MCRHLTRVLHSPGLKANLCCLNTKPRLLPPEAGVARRGSRPPSLPLPAAESAPSTCTRGPPAGFLALESGFCREFRPQCSAFVSVRETESSLVLCYQPDSASGMPLLRSGEQRRPGTGTPRPQVNIAAEGVNCCPSFPSLQDAHRRPNCPGFVHPSLTLL